MENWRSLEYLSVKEIAQILNIHINTAYDLTRKLPHIKVGKTYRVATKVLEKWIRDQERSNAG